MLTIKRKGTDALLKLKNESKTPYLSYPQLEETGIVKHGFSTRLGGVSTAHLSSLNLSFARGDKESAVRENFERIADAIGFETSDMVFTVQTHTTNVRVATQADKGKGFDIPIDYQDVDGLVTNVPGIVLVTFYADCVPLYFVDPVKKAIGLSHSGWKGTVGQIGKKTIETMTDTYGSRPEDIIAAIGPSICQDCYEVSEDVIQEFKQSFQAKYWDALFYQKANGKYQLNLWKTNEIIFRESGIKPENINTTDICTCCNPKLLYSHRASKGMRGNLAAFLGLK